MKSYFNKSWKKVFLVIGIVLIVVDLFFIVTSPTVIPQQYLEYGPSMEGDLFDKADEITDEIGEEIDENSGNKDSSGEDSGIVSDVSDKTGLPSNVTKILLFFGIGIIVVLALSALLDSEGGSDKKK